jgi:hypothetical protein
MARISMQVVNGCRICRLPQLHAGVAQDADLAVVLGQGCSTWCILAPRLPSQTQSCGCAASTARGACGCPSCPAREGGGRSRLRAVARIHNRGVSQRSACFSFRASRSASTATRGAAPRVPCVPRRPFNSRPVRASAAPANCSPTAPSCHILAHLHNLTSASSATVVRHSLRRRPPPRFFLRRLRLFFEQVLGARRELVGPFLHVAIVDVFGDGPAPPRMVHGPPCNDAHALTRDPYRDTLAGRIMICVGATCGIEVCGSPRTGNMEGTCCHSRAGATAKLQLRTGIYWRCRLWCYDGTAGEERAHLECAARAAVVGKGLRADTRGRAPSIHTNGGCMPAHSVRLPKHGGRLIVPSVLISIIHHINCPKCTHALHIICRCGRRTNKGGASGGVCAARPRPHHPNIDVKASEGA